MSELLQTSAFIALFTCGLYYLSLEGYPLYYFRLFIYRVLGIKYNAAKDETDFPNNFIEQLNKPLIGCPPCMCSFWGIGLSFLLSYNGFVNDLIISEVVSYAVSIFIAGGINRIITQMLSH